MGDMLQKRLKKYMDDIIDHAFSDKDVFERNGYKAYKLNILTKENGSSSGMYTYAGYKIEIYNPSLGARHLAKCCLHELSHHIDYMQNGKSGHQKPFYEIYTRLIYASLDLGILSVQDFDDNWSSDQNKVRAIVAKYEPHPVSYDTGSFKVIRVHNGYPVRDFLKREGSGFYYNKIEQIWEKELESNDEGYVQKEKAVLDGAGILAEKGDAPWYEICDPGMHMAAVVYIAVQGNTYSCQDALKEEGFFFSSRRNAMIMKTDADTCRKKLDGLQCNPVFSGCKFGILNRKD